MNNVILVGNPNTGKSTLFNSLTKANEHTGNWHGVTVNSKQKQFIVNAQKFVLVDLPGIYSMTPLSFEEQVAVQYIHSHNNSLIVNIVDVNNLFRNLYLTLDLIALNMPMILVINQTSKIEKSLYNLNIKKLEIKLGIKVIKLDATKKHQVDKLKKEIFNYYNSKKPYFSSNQDILKLNNLQHITLENLCTKKYEYIKKLLDECQIKTFGNKQTNRVYGKSKIDKVVLNKFLCLPIFFLVMLAVFYITFFSVGAWLSSGLLYLVQDVFGAWLLGFVKSVTQNVIIYDFFASAIIGGLGSVLSFLPQVVLLFLCLGVLEDSGYLSRVAFCLDDIFARVGLSGKSVYTLLMGFGCSTSACLTARTMEDKNTKIKTAMLAPYMSCSAKLPIYAVIGSAFFGANNVFVIFALYMLGVVVALILSIFYEKTFLKSGKQSFILEFPPYRITNPSRLLHLALDNTKQFLVRVGSLLVSVNVIVWLLSNFSFSFAYVSTQGGQSMLEILGKILSPIFIPLGFGSWGATSALIAGLVAKEIIVSSLAMFNGISSSSNGFNAKLSQSLTNATSVVCFTPASALSYMVFCLLYSPCFATIGVLSKEIGKKWTFVSIVVQFTIAYIASLVVYSSVNLIMTRGVLLFLLFASIFVICIFAITFLIKYILKKRKCKNCTTCIKSR